MTIGSDSETRLDSPREYPHAPRVGVGAVVLAEDRVLLIQRGRAPLVGEWSLPGGVLELGETLADGVAREVLEETGIAVEPVEILLTLDRIVRDEAERVRYHYVIVDWLCRAEDARIPQPGDDAQAAVWADCDDLGSFNLTEAMRGVIAQGRARLQELA